MILEVDQALTNQRILDNMYMRSNLSTFPGLPQRMALADWSTKLATAICCL